jgi:hypothetical protein
LPKILVNIAVLMDKHGSIRMLKLWLGGLILCSHCCNLVLSQKVPFAEHYDETHAKNKASESDKWRNPSSDSNFGRNFGSSPYNYTSKERYEDKDLNRDHPDPSINWLSPNPFAPPNTGNRDPNRNKELQQSNFNTGGFSNSSGNYFGGGGFSNQQPNQRYPQQPLDSTLPAWDQNSRSQPPSSFDRNRTGFNNSVNQYGQNQNRYDNSGRDRNYQGGSSANFNNVNLNTVPVDPFAGTGTRRDEDLGNLRGGSADPNRPFPSSNSQDYNKPRDPFSNRDQYSNVGPRSGYPTNYPGSSSSGDRRGTSGNIPDYPTRSSGVPDYPINPQYPDTSYNDRSINPSSSFGNPSNPVPGQGGGSTYDSSGRRNILPFGNYPGRGNFDPGYPNVNVWNEYWTTTTYRPTAAGVLGRWRPELQGQQRPEDINQVPQSVYVMTNFGRVQVCCMLTVKGSFKLNDRQASCYQSRGSALGI